MKNTIAIALAVILVAGCFIAAGDPTAYAASKWNPKKTFKGPIKPAPVVTEPVAPAPTEPVAPAPTEPVAPAPTEPVAPAPTEPVAPAPTEPVEEPVTAPVVTEPVPPVTPTPEAIVLPAAKNYLYVAPTGSDSNNGSAEAPFRTIQKAANVAKAGDAVLIREGTYKEKVKPANSGNATDGHILFTNYNGEVVTIDGTGISVAKGTALFDVAYRSYIKVEGLRIINSSWTGFGSPYASPGSTRNIIIRNCFISNTQSSGINLSYAKDILIDGNTIQYANTLPASQGGSDEALTVGATDGFVISNNYLSNMGKEGIDAKGGANNGKIFGNVIEAPPIMGIYIDAFHASQSNIEIYNNTINNAVHNGIVLAIEYNGTLSDINIHHNTINKAKRGISITTYGSSPYVMNNIIIDQNTMVGTTICGLDLSNDQAKNVTITKNYFGGTSTSIPIYNNGGYIPANGFVIDGNKLNRVVTGHPTGTNYSLI
jgi:polygalacturonase